MYGRFEEGGVREVGAVAEEWAEKKTYALLTRISSLPPVRLTTSSRQATMLFSSVTSSWRHVKPGFPAKTSRTEGLRAVAMTCRPIKPHQPTGRYILQYWSSQKDDGRSESRVTTLAPLLPKFAIGHSVDTDRALRSARLRRGRLHDEIPK